MQNKVASINQSKILTQNLSREWGPIQIKEVLRVIKKLKRRKATGPDEVPPEILKEMDDEEMDDVMTLLSEWRETGCIPDEVTLAKVDFIFKKGHTKGSQKLQTHLSSQYAL